jgi:GH15 family glucan-1,4-alpha-glucosidase
VKFRTELVIRFGYGGIVPWVTRTEDGTINAMAGPERMVVRTPAALNGEDLKTVGEFTISAGQSVPFVLSYGPSFESAGAPIDPFKALASTAHFWRQWSSRCPDVRPLTRIVKRSLITLKALTYAPTGGIVAAVTTSLPERLGGSRNRDYRFCWLRDATFTVLAFMHLGYNDEAQVWRDWLIRAIAGSPHQVQILYGAGGERWLPELVIPWLAGYENSSPVRVGNTAAQQLQIDVFGEVADVMFQARKAGMKRSERALATRSAVLEHLAAA